MTDKEIIIDGVNVSECIYFKMNNKIHMCRACNSGVGSPYCEYHKDCYYKQLKRKEQENSKHKLTLDIIEEYCMQCNLRWDFTAQIVLDIINKVKEQ